MFRFSINKDTPLDVSGRQLVSAGITEDEDYAQRLDEDGEYRADERYFRAENETPGSLEAAITFVQGIFFHAPSRVWIGENSYEVTEEALRGVRKPEA